ncbi:MAG: GrpB family protein [Cyanobacteria bacterium J06632_3]
MRTVEVVPHRPEWRDAFEAESKRIAEALGDNVVEIHHIGSTAIPRIYAKPIIDLLVEVKDIAKVDAQNSAMQVIGYDTKGEYGIPQRRYFQKSKSDKRGSDKNSAAESRTHHVHIFEVGSNQVARHLTFRDYMIAHPEEAQRYSDLKRRLAKEHSTNRAKYIDGKDGFIKAIDRKALQWRKLYPDC